jgi:uncharacterized protein YfaS (alpha-2-macroglobulin family)
MMHRYIPYFLLLLGLVSFTCNSLKNTQQSSQTTPMLHDERWSQVDSLEQQGLYRSAWDLTDVIYQDALGRGDYQTQYKALCYQLKYADRVEEGSELQSIKKLRLMAEEAPMPLQAIAHNMTAEAYWNYYQQHRWEIINRTPAPGIEDIRFWDLGRFVEEIDTHFSASLVDIPGLKAVKIKELDKELVSDTSSIELRPSLYEMLAYRALAFYQNSESGLTRPKEFFQIDTKQFYAPGVEFSEMEFSQGDTLAFKHKAVKIFQGLLKYQEKESPAWLSTDLARLQFISNHSSLPDNEGAVSDMHLLAALDHALENYKRSELLGEYQVAKAQLYVASAYGYNYGAEQGKKDHFLTAERIAEQVLESYPKTRAENQAQNLLLDIRQKSMSLQLEEVLIPGTADLLKIEHRNLDKVYFRVVQVAPDFMEGERYDMEKYLRKLCKQPVMQEWSVELKGAADHHQHSTETMIPSLDAEHYAVIASEDEGFSGGDAMAYAMFWVTHIALEEGPHPSGGSWVNVKNRDNGQAIKGATVIHYVNDYDRSARKYIQREHGRYTTDSDGQVHIPFVQNGYNQSLTVQWQGEEYRSGFYSRHPRSRQQDWYSTQYFLDRAIYRPGQTLHFKGIHLKNSEAGPSIQPNTSIEVTLRDANHQEVSKQTLRSNDYGSIHGTFTLPSSGLTGSMTLQSNHGSISFSVEEYKRPKFKVELDSLEGVYKLDEMVKATGQALSYAGVPITDAQVRYTVQRKPVYIWKWGWWYRMPSQNESAVQIAQGLAETDGEGRFALDFEAVGGNDQGAEGFSHYTFSIQVEVTDINGETREASNAVNIGKKGLLLSSDIPTEWDTEQLRTVKVKSTNLNGKEVSSSGQWTIRRLPEDTREKVDRRWGMPQYQSVEQATFESKLPLHYYNTKDKRSDAKGEKVIDGEWSTSSDLHIPSSVFEGLSTGRYLLEITSAGPEQADHTTEFRLFQSKEGKNSFAEAFRVTDLADVYVPGETARILISSQWEDLPVEIRVEHKNQIVQREELTLDKSQKIFELAIKKSHQEGVFIHISALKNNRVFKQTLDINVKPIDRLLDVDLVTYRDKMMPGADEQWKLKVKAQNGEKVMSELLLSMYDASLDQFKMHEWSFSPWRKNHAWLDMDYRGFGTASGRVHAPNWRTQRTYMPGRSFPTLNRFGYYPNFYGNYRFDGEMVESVVMSAAPGKRRMAKAESAAMNMDMADADAMMVEEGEVDNNVAGGAPPADETVQESGTEQGPSIRTNLQETAFFFPEITTDAEGNLNFGFTMPEALTTWKFQALAHSKSLQTGGMSEEVITQKDLMVIPNPPRFFREGDVIYMSTKLSSLSEEPENGSIRLEIADAISGKEVSSNLIDGAQSQSFSLEANGNAAFSWKVEVPDTYSALTYRFIAEGQTHSDGEENSLPVLSNRMLVTESMPFAILKESEKTFEFTRMAQVNQSNTLKPHALTLEFTANPIWYAVQAMPYMMEYPYDCSEQVFTRYYANSLASNIISERPRLQEVIKAWEQYEPDAFLSNLEKNQELKYVILEETPWVMEAQDEGERKKRLSLLLDINHMAQRQERAMNKLKQNQDPSGGWPWFSGMRPSLYITQYIVSGLGHLKHLGILDQNDPAMNEMISSAIRYMDEEHLERWRRMKRYDKDWEKNDHTGAFEIQYLYARSFWLDKGLPSGGAFDYYKKQAAEFWTKKGVYMQGMSAMALHRLDEKDVAKSIMRSVKEQAMMDDELGMYWKDQRAGWYWYEAGIERHALMVEAFSEIMQDEEAVYGLKQWLIFNKQTNDWETTRATAEAVYALLLGGNDWTQERDWSITVGNETFASDDPKLGTEAGTGYLKKKWDRGEIRPKMSEVKVTKEGEAPAWGALYYQYFENLDKITQADSPLAVRKQVFKVKRSDTGEELVELNDGAALSVGDRVRVRMEIETDREMEYVHIKDMRSAGMEPVDVLSGMVYSGGLGFYRNTRDAATNFFIDDLRKGAYVLEYDVFVSHRGDFSNGITTIQCMYAPEFTSHSEGIRILVE